MRKTPVKMHPKKSNKKLKLASVILCFPLEKQMQISYEDFYPLCCQEIYLFPPKHTKSTLCFRALPVDMTLLTHRACRALPPELL